MKNFINSLQTVPGHYCRQDSKKMYLEQRFQKKQDLYETYLNLAEKSGVRIVPLEKFYKIFKTMNIR